VGTKTPRPVAKPIDSLTRKAPLAMTTQPDAGPRRLRAAIIGFGLDGSDSQQRLSTGDQCILVGGSAETHAEMLETMLRLESELERLGQGLADVTPSELLEIAWRIDSPELHQIALRMRDGLERNGRTFHESSAEELTEFSSDNGLV
jgi:hypothetical protein